MLKHKIEIYIPTNNSKQTGIMMDVFKRFCKEFGGATVNPVLGGWLDDRGELITDKISIVYSYAEEISQDTLRMLKLIAVEIREALDEDTIMMAIDNKADFY